MKCPGRGRILTPAVSASSAPGLHTTYWVKCLLCPWRNSPPPHPEQRPVDPFIPATPGFLGELSKSTAETPLSTASHTAPMFAHRQGTTRPASVQKQAAGRPGAFLEQFRISFYIKWKEAEDQSSSPCSATHLVCGQEQGPPELYFPHLCTELSPNTLSEESTECPWKLQ